MLLNWGWTNGSTDHSSSSCGAVAEPALDLCPAAEIGPLLLLYRRQQNDRWAACSAGFFDGRNQVYLLIVVKKYFACILITGFCLSCSKLNAGTTHPAIVGTGPDSFAAKLHYPEKAKAARKQAAVFFYCEVGPDGKPGQIQVVEGGGRGNQKGAFTSAVDQALRLGRFRPAMVEGRAVRVIVGGTVLFLFNGNKPQVVVSLSTDKEKILDWLITLGRR